MALASTISSTVITRTLQIQRERYDPDGCNGRQWKTLKVPSGVFYAISALDFILSRFCHLLTRRRVDDEYRRTRGSVAADGPCTHAHGGVRRGKRDHMTKPCNRIGSGLYSKVMFLRPFFI